tara:strand:- start:1872 stop:2204 length:333 start_codon:yes stop_codon:yes gene_type:complete
VSNPNFHELVDDVFLSIEDSIEDSDIDIDYENANGMLTLTFEENASQIILSRQFSTSEIWIAAKSGGFHFKLDQYDEAGAWRNTVTGETMNQSLSNLCFQQSGARIAFSF